MTRTPEQVAATIVALEAQRALLGDAVLDMALAPLHRELAAMQARLHETPQQLKQVSVLFVDVVGSTAMGQQLGPEEIHAVMDGALERFTAVVHSQHGRVLQYTGDGMLAAFGTQAAGEDDVERAIRAGLEIIDEAHRQAPQVRRLHGVADFDVRAGVHTGTALLGGGVDAEGSIRGATVNVAARMEQSAPPGRLRISHDSYRHVRGLFEVTEQAPIQVKGVAQPLRSYLVDRAKPRAFRVPTRGIEGVQTRMVGRDVELGLLRMTFEAAVVSGKARALTVVGEGGLGKSRLLAEFQQTLSLDTCWLLLARAHPRSALHPYGMLRDFLTRQFQIAESDPAEVGRIKLVDGLAPLFASEGEGDAEAQIHVLGHLIGLDFSGSPHVKEILSDETRLQARGFEVAALCLRRLAESKPVVIVFDDLHWADVGSLAFVRHLLLANADTALLCLMLTRPTLFEAQPDWCADDPQHARIDLAPLGKGASRELAEVLLQRLDEVPVALRALLTGGAEGNPFYMEELVKMLIDDGVILADSEGWRVLPDKLLEARVPATLTGVLQARLDALGPAERQALQQAAVVGHVFWDRALGAIDAAAAQALPVLLRKRLVVAHDVPTVDDSVEYAFAHNLLHQVTYDSVLKAPKRTAHAAVGAFWSARAEVAVPQNVTPATCRALAEAHHHRCRAGDRDYPDWFDRQFSPYLNAYAASTLRPLAEGLIGICEEHFGADRPETAQALNNLARVFLIQGRVEQAEPLLRRALTIEERALEPDHPQTAQTLAALGGAHEGRGDMNGARPFYERVLALRERVLGSDHPLTLCSADNLGKVLLELGRFDEAERLSRRVLAAREHASGPDHPDTAFALTALGELLAKTGEFAAAEPLVRRALAIQQACLPAEHPDTGLSMWHLADILRGLGRCAEGEPLARRALAAWEANFGPDHEWTAWGLIGLAKNRLACGVADEAALHAERAAGLVHAAYGPNHAVFAETLQLWAEALKASDRLEHAALVLARGLAIQAGLTSGNEQTAPPSDAVLAKTREWLAKA